MALDQTVASAESPALTICKIGLSDLRDVLAKGYADFTAMPSHAVFLCVVYPIIGLTVGRFVTGQSLLPMLFPVVAGYALVGPFAALGLYELSRRRELGLDTSPSHVFDILRSPAIIPIVELGAIFTLIFLMWLTAARTIYSVTFHDVMPTSVDDLVHQVLSTRAGWTLAIVGNGVGFVFAVAAFSFGVVSFPLVLDTHVSAAKAVSTSLRAVATNPIPMALWGIFIAAALVLGSLPLFIGLIVVMPVLGHASWHLYRRLVKH